jgi:predicted RNA-binding Zn-ribbon protein involved in translation (DUF1610 family)
MSDTASRKVSDDGLWEWDGKRWARSSRVEARCGSCGNSVVVRSNDRSFKCPNGHVQDFVVCDTCDWAFQRPHKLWKYVVPCPQCGTSSTHVLLQLTSAWREVRDEKSRAQLGIAGGDARILRSFSLAGAGGTAIPLGSECDVMFAADVIRILSTGGHVDNVPYREVHAVEVTGSTTRSSAGVFGGGFGVAGAAEGMLVASVINSLSARRTVYTVLRVAAAAAEYVFVSYKFDSSALQTFLTPVQVRIRNAQTGQQSLAPPPSSSFTSVADELAKLAQLRDSGVLADSEFAAAKARLLGGSELG